MQVFEKLEKQVKRQLAGFTQLQKITYIKRPEART